MKIAFYSKRGWLLAAGVFFSFASAWVPYIEQVGGRNLFVTSDSMTLLGVTILIAMLSAYLLPDFVLNGLSRFWNHFAVVLPRSVSLFLSLAALGSLVWVLYNINQVILHAFLSSADEHSCYFLAECLRKGKLYVEIPPLADFFKVVHVGMKGGKWFSVYPPGWPLLWAVGLKFHIVDWLNPVQSVIAVYFLYLSGERLFGRMTAALGLLLMCLNPFFMFTAASYFSHATCLLCISVFLYAFLRWREAYDAGRDPVGWSFVCAFAVGYGLMTRYLTVAAVAAPFLLYHYLSIFFEWRGWGNGKGLGLFCHRPFVFKRPRFRKSDGVAIVVIGLFMALILWQNYLVTGKAFKAPNKYDKSWERLGFRKNYTFLDAFFYLIARVFFLMDWFAPAVVAAYLWLLGRKKSLSAISALKDPGARNGTKIIKRLFFLTMVFVAGAYFFYYSWGGNQWGPRYLWEGMPFLCMTVAGWAVAQWENGGMRARKFLLVFMTVSFVSSGILFVKQAEFTEEASFERRSLYDLAEQTVEGPGIVFIHGFLGDRLVLSEDDAVRNSPFLDGRILYVHDLGERNKELTTAYPGRSYYRGWYDREMKKPLLEPLAV
ncbi:MAG: glycosyltransferase family 39 protein [Candidatus Omnitrophota bacterium]